MVLHFGTSQILFAGDSPNKKEPDARSCLTMLRSGDICGSPGHDHPSKTDLPL